MAEDAGAAVARGRDAGDASPAEVDDHVDGVDVEGFEANLDAEFGRGGLAVYDVVACAALVEGGRVEERIDGVGRALGEVDCRCGGVDDDLDLGVIARLAEGVGVAAVRPLGGGVVGVVKAVGGDGVECVGRGAGCAFQVGGGGGEQLKGRAGKDWEECDGWETANG